MNRREHREGAEYAEIKRKDADIYQNIFADRYNKKQQICPYEDAQKSRRDNMFIEGR